MILSAPVRLSVRSTHRAEAGHGDDFLEVGPGERSAGLVVGRSPPFPRRSSSRSMVAVRRNGGSSRERGLRSLFSAADRSVTTPDCSLHSASRRRSSSIFSKVSSASSRQRAARPKPLSLRSPVPYTRAVCSETRQHLVGQGIGNQRASPLDKGSNGVLQDLVNDASPDGGVSALQFLLDLPKPQVHSGRRTEVGAGLVGLDPAGAARSRSHPLSQGTSIHRSSGPRTRRHSRRNGAAVRLRPRPAHDGLRPTPHADGAGQLRG